jgi:hypothetical protein
MISSNGNWYAAKNIRISRQEIRMVWVGACDLGNFTNPKARENTRTTRRQVAGAGSSERRQ